MMIQEDPPRPLLAPETEALLRRLWDELPFYMGLVEMDEEGEILFLYVNTPNAQAFGIPRDEVVGLRASRLAPPETLQLWRDAYLKAMDTGKMVEFEAYMGPEKQYFFSVATVYLGRSAAGRPRFGFAYRNTTPLRQSEELLRSILASSPSYILATDRDFKIMSFSGPTQIDATQFIGQDAFSLGAPDQTAAMRAIFEQVLRTGEVAQHESTDARNPASPAWYSLAVGPLRRGGQIAGLTVVGTDITPRKRLEAELTRKNDELEREIEERRRAEELLRKKQDEILAVSTPILKVWSGVLALPIIGALDAARAAHVMETLLHAIAADRARVAILDLTGVEEVDTATAGHLLRIARAIGLLGSRCFVSGISPRIAQTMTSIGIGAEGFATFGTLEDALRHALEGAGAAGKATSR